MDNNIEVILNRHIGRCLTDIEERYPNIDFNDAKKTIKKEMRFLAEDIEEELSGNLTEVSNNG